MCARVAGAGRTPSHSEYVQPRPAGGLVRRLPRPRWQAERLWQAERPPRSSRPGGTLPVTRKGPGRRGTDDDRGKAAARGEARVGPGVHHELRCRPGL